VKCCLNPEGLKASKGDINPANQTQTQKGRYLSQGGTENPPERKFQMGSLWAHWMEVIHDNGPHLSHPLLDVNYSQDIATQP